MTNQGVVTVSVAFEIIIHHFSSNTVLRTKKEITKRVKGELFIVGVWKCSAFSQKPLRIAYKPFSMSPQSLNPLENQNPASD